jgi:hypothetical protein
MKGGTGSGMPSIAEPPNEVACWKRLTPLLVLRECHALRYDCASESGLQVNKQTVASYKRTEITKFSWSNAE